MRSLISAFFWLICLVVLFATSSPSLALSVEVTVKQMTVDQILVNILYVPTDQEVVSVVAYFTKEFKVGYPLTRLSDDSFSLETTLLTNETTELTLAVKLSNGALVYELYGSLPLPTNDTGNLTSHDNSLFSIIAVTLIASIPLISLALVVILWTYERSRQFPRGE